MVGFAVFFITLVGAGQKQLNDGPTCAWPYVLWVCVHAVGVHHCR